MKTVKCDRCGKIMYPSDSRLLSFDIPIRLVLKHRLDMNFYSPYHDNWQYSDVDLCGSCYGQLMEWLHPDV